MTTTTYLLLNAKTDTNVILIFFYNEDKLRKKLFPKTHFYLSLL